MLIGEKKKRKRKTQRRGLSLLHANVWSDESSILLLFFFFAAKLCEFIVILSIAKCSIYLCVFARSSYSRYFKFATAKHITLGTKPLIFVLETKQREHKRALHLKFKVVFQMYFVCTSFENSGVFQIER